MAIRISDLNAGNRSVVESFLAKDRWGNLYLLGDLESAEDRCTFRIAHNGERVSGVMVTLDFPDYPIIWITGEYMAKRSLLESADMSHFVLIADEDMLSTIKRYFPDAKAYREDVMHLSAGKENAFAAKSVKRIPEEMTDEWARSLNDGKPPDMVLKQKARQQLRSSECFGFILGGRIVSRGCVDIKSSYGWALGRVYTVPEYRGRGFATGVVAGIIDYGSASTTDFALFVRSDNTPAIRSYAKLGFEKTGNKVFVDRNTGQKP